MKAVFIHEVKSYFTNIIAYIFGAGVLLFAGIFTAVYNLASRSATFEYVLSGMVLIFIIGIPIITMKIIAEERKQKTDQLLYSLPISMPQIVIGKYLAVIVVLAVPTVIIAIYPLILSAFGDVYLPSAYNAIVGYFFLGTSLISIGMFISSVTENQIIAAVLCAVAILINYFSTALVTYLPSSSTASLIELAIVIIILAFIIRLMTKSTLAAVASGIVLEIGLAVWFILSSSSFAGLFGNIIRELSLFDRYGNFLNGICDITGILYFLSVSAFFIFLSIQSMEKRRWSN